MDKTAINWDSIPDIITKDQLYQICHISKSTALYRLCICFAAERYRANTRARKLAVTKSKRLTLLHISKREKYFPNPIQHRLGGTRGTIQ